MSLLPGSPNSLPPVALLGAFGIKSQGATPRPLDGLQFVFDAAQYYLRAQEVVQRFTASVAAVGVTTLLDATTSAPLIVPAGKGWLVSGVVGRATTTALQCYRGVIVGSAPAQGGTVEIAELCSEMRSSATDANGVAYATSAWDKGPIPILFGPGCNFHALCRVLTGGPVTVTGGLRYYEVPY